MADFSLQLPDSGFAFDLHLMCGGFAYFSTITRWEKDGEHGREYRQPSTVTVAKFLVGLEALGQHAILIRHQSDYQHWLLKRGWAITSVDAARSIMSHWLKSQECVKSAADTYTDVALAAPGALKQYTGRGRRESITLRDGGCCLLCGRSAEDEVKLTIQHVRPFSCGGETTSHNLVVLCFECNQRLAAQELSELYDLAGLPHGCDLGLLKGETSAQSLQWAMIVSDNLMHTRCEVW